MIIPGTFRLPFGSLAARVLRRSARDEKGAALVEAALTMVLLTALLLGIIEVCLALFSFHFVANAARAATRYAIVRGGSWSTSCDGTGSAGSGYTASACTASTTDIKNFIGAIDFPGVTIGASDVCVQYWTSVPASPSTTCTDGANSTDNAPGDIVQVSITYPFTFDLPLLGSHSYNLASTSEMTIAQ